MSLRQFSLKTVLQFILQEIITPIINIKKVKSEVIFAIILTKTLKSRSSAKVNDFYVNANSAFEYFTYSELLR